MGSCDNPLDDQCRLHTNKALRCLQAMDTWIEAAPSLVSAKSDRLSHMKICLGDQLPNDQFLPQWQRAHHPHSGYSTCRTGYKAAMSYPTTIV